MRASAVDVESAVVERDESQRKTEPIVPRPVVPPANPPSAARQGVQPIVSRGFMMLPSVAMPLSRTKILIAFGTILLLAVVTADYWVRALAGAVIEQAVIPLARLIVDVFT